MLNIECVFILSTPPVFTLLTLRRSRQDIIINVKRPSCKVPFILSDVNETQFFLKIFERSLNIKFHENPSRGSRVVSCGQTVRQTDRHARS